MQTVWVVITEWGGPSYKNPGDADEFTIEAVCTTKANAEERARVAARQNVAWGHEELDRSIENWDTWAFDMHVQEMPLL